MSWKDVPGLVDSDKLTDEAAAAIESVKIKTDEDGNQTVEVKFWNKMPAITKLGEHKKLWGSKEDAGAGQTLFMVFLEGIRSGELPSRNCTAKTTGSEHYRGSSSAGRAKGAANAGKVTSTVRRGTRRERSLPNLSVIGTPAVKIMRDTIPHLAR
jgi:hypothetical protein